MNDISITLKFTSALAAANFLADMAGEAIESVEATSGAVPDVDGDGMPYDAAVHSNPPSLTAKGLWKAQKGKAEQAEAARAAFKAGGGGIAAPTPVAVAPVAMPVFPTAMPVMPAAPAPAPVVTFEQLVAKMQTAMNAGKIDAAGVVALYGQAGITDPAALANDLELCGKLYALLP